MSLSVRNSSIALQLWSIIARQKMWSLAQKIVWKSLSIHFLQPKFYLTRSKKWRKFIILIKTYVLKPLFKDWIVQTKSYFFDQDIFWFCTLKLGKVQYFLKSKGYNLRKHFETADMVLLNIFWGFTERLAVKIYLKQYVCTHLCITQCSNLFFFFIALPHTWKLSTACIMDFDKLNLIWRFDFRYELFFGSALTSKVIQSDPKITFSILLRHFIISLNPWYTM